MVTTTLLDSNVLVALIWPAHEAHARVLRWFERNAQRGWSTCPFTEAAAVRLISNPSFSRDALTPEQALSALQTALGENSHRFWPDDISLADAVAPFRARLQGHRQFTDAYLLGLTLHNKGRLATLDRGVPDLLARDDARRNHIELIAGGDVN